MANAWDVISDPQSPIEHRALISAYLCYPVEKYLCHPCDQIYLVKILTKIARGLINMKT